MEGALLLDVVVTQSATILELLASEDQTLLIRRDSFLILDLLLHSLDGIRSFDLEGDSLASEGLDENLHATSKAEDKMEGALLLDVVVTQSATVFELLAGEDQTLLIRRDSFLILDLLLHSLDGTRGFDLEGDSLASEGLDENLHRCWSWSCSEPRKSFELRKSAGKCKRIKRKANSNEKAAN